MSVKLDYQNNNDAGVEMTLGFSGYLMAAIAYFVLATLLLTSWRGRLLGGLLVTAVLANLVWAAYFAYEAQTSTAELSSYFLIESVRYALWYLFLFKLLNLLRTSEQANKMAVILPAVVFIGVIGFVTYNLYLSSIGVDDFGSDVIYQRIVGNLSMSIFGLVLVEQLFRNTRPEHRWSVKYLFFGLGSLFIFDFFLYADALLFRGLNTELWQARGFINVLTVPMLAVAAARNREWSLDIFVSRKMVFHTAAVLGAGAYLLVMAAVGYYIKAFGGSWGGAAQIIFLFLSFFLLIVLFFSDILRAKFKVFFRKNFFRYQYDYREEWLKITEKLSEGSGGEQVRKVVIRAISDFVDSSGGMLWMREESIGYVCITTVNIDETEHVIKSNDILAKYLSEKDSIIDIQECSEYPDRYDGLQIPEWLLDLKKPWIIIPMKHQEGLLGFLILNLPRAKREANWEDRDLLMTACKQAASYLALLKATETLKQGDQFAAFNRLSSYVVHDLKNLVAQLSLVVKNAEKFKSNPDFVDDAFSTVKNATDKMERLLMQLRKGRFEDTKGDILQINDVMNEVIRDFADFRPQPVLYCDVGDARVVANHDRFTSVIGHLIRNAQEATSTHGSVILNVITEGQKLVIRIQDDGTGMDMKFIKERLFAPFETTKGNAGMGVGVYESREFIQSLGGSMNVRSTPGEGSTFILSIPVYQENREQ